MTRSPISARRRMAGVATAALLSLGLLTACGSGSSDTDASSSNAGASSAGPSQKAESHPDSSDGGAKGHTKPSPGAKGGAEGGEVKLLTGDTLTPRTFQWNVDGGTEALSEVSDLTMDQPTQQVPSNTLIPGQQQSGTMTVTRGSERSQQFTNLIDGATQPQTASLDVLDHTGNATRRYTLQEPRVIKVENPPTGDAQSVTIKFTSLTIG
ncbi:hypothetical protein GPA10_25200 [Streptomyces sp. p1417]|uniref:Lipoprotein n=1 Tax=Streptomyces typhae TaxID=2681492 RepID=A0A6L6X2C1_9ACTN|nr:phage tail protein [Streptomyces typhae]MVO87965.1 hypothetical protein [Streptomyces typhae]